MNKFLKGIWTSYSSFMYDLYDDFAFGGIIIGALVTIAFMLIALGVVVFICAVPCISIFIISIMCFVYFAAKRYETNMKKSRYADYDDDDF